MVIRDNGGIRTKPDSCCKPCNRHAMVRARRLPPTPNSSAQLSSRAISHGALRFVGPLQSRREYMASSSAIISVLMARKITSTTASDLVPYTLLRIFLARPI